MTGPAEVRNEISGGIFFAAVIQGRTIKVTLPPSVHPALAGLPDASPVFVGREADLRRLMRRLDPARSDGVRLTMVSGLAGVGKTELTLQAAHAAWRNGWFPGGVLFVNMYGYDPRRRVESGTALEGLLGATSIPPEHIPGETQDRSRLFSSVLAAYAGESRPVLVVADNVSSADQVLPLLPAGGTAIVTSRHTLADLDGRLLEVTSLSPEAGVELLAGQLQLARGAADTRIADHRDHALSISRQCAGLPLALRIAAARLATHPERPLASMVSELEKATTRLDALRYVTGDSGHAVRAAFELSYRQLEPAQARLFRLLSLNPGPDVSAGAVSAMAELNEQAVSRELEVLARAHLLDVAASYGRWKMHDLLRVYCDQLSEEIAETDARELARDKLLEYYLTKAEAAREHVGRLTGKPPSPVFASRTQAIEWLDAERPSLLAAVTMAAEHSRDQFAARLPVVLAEYLGWRRRFDEAAISLTAAIGAARRLGDPRGEAMALNNRGLVLANAGKFTQASEDYQQAAAIHEAIGNRSGEAQAVGNLGILLYRQRRFDEALAAHERNLAICRELGERHREGIILTNLGIVLHELRRFEEAAAAHRAGVKICQEFGDRSTEGQVVENLGTALYKLGQLDEAISAHRQAMAIALETRDRHAEGTTLANLGNDLRRSKRYEEAIEAHRKALTIFRETEDRDSEGSVLDDLGRDLRHTGDFDAAIQAHEEALALFRELGDRHSQALALDGLGLSLRAAGRDEEASAKHRQAAGLFHEMGDQYRQTRSQKHSESA